LGVVYSFEIFDDPKVAKVPKVIASDCFRYPDLMSDNKNC